MQTRRKKGGRRKTELSNRRKFSQSFGAENENENPDQSDDSQSLLSEEEIHHSSIHATQEENHEMDEKEENLEMILEKFTSYSLNEFKPKPTLTKGMRIRRKPLVVFCDFEMQKKELIFMRNGVHLFRLKPKDVQCQSFNFKSILTTYNRAQKEKIIIMEIETEKENLKEFEKLLAKRNTNQCRNLTLSSKFKSTAQDSPFTDKSKVLNLRGFLNLFILYSLFNYSRLIIQHTVNYKAVFWNYWDIMFPDGNTMLFALTMVIYASFFGVIYMVQKQGLRGKMTNSQTNYLSLALISLYFIFISIYVYHLKVSIFLAVALNGCSVSVLFKCISMAHVLSQVRDTLKFLQSEDIETKGYHDLFRENEVSEESYLILLKHLDEPEALLTPKKFAFYIIIPTFNFNLRYARKDSFDKIFFIKRSSEFVILWSLFLFMIAQIVLPILEESDEIFLMESTIIDKALYIVRLAIPSTVSWILMFMAVFHGYCQAVAELFHLADRCFYLDWWNCRNLAEYWRTWNKPIHNFFVRHVAGPLKSYGLSRHVVNTIIFMISAVFHEYVISLAIKRLCIYTFFSFSLQYFYMIFELIILKKFKLEKSVLGNYNFWFLFCFYGQPTLVLTYYFWIKYDTEFVLSPF